MLVLALPASTPTVAVEEDDINSGGESEGVEEVLVERGGAAYACGAASMSMSVKEIMNVAENNRFLELPVKLLKVLPQNTLHAETVLPLAASALTGP